MANSNKIALLLINTGSPDAPTEEAVRRYLAEFLGDRRIVELPRWKWWPILHGIILRTRPKKSAERYRGVWTDEGSPLIVHTRRTAGALEAELGIPVYWSMRYGSPSTASVLDRMKADGVGRVLVMPVFAQYASQTSFLMSMRLRCARFTTITTIPPTSTRLPRTCAPTGTSTARP